MEPRTTLTGYILSRFLHGIRILLITASTSLFISHTAIAQNIKNKAPAPEDSSASTRSILNSLVENQSMTPENPAPGIGIESEIKGSETSNTSTQQNNYKQTKASTTINEIAANYTTIPGKPEKGDEIEIASAKLQSCHILFTVQQKTGASDSEMTLFANYYYDKLFGTDVSAFWNQVRNEEIITGIDVQNYANQKIDEYVQLFNTFKKIEQDYPSSIAEYTQHKTHAATGACNPACDNIGFENGNLSAWSAYYAQNTSSTSAFAQTTPTGGACGAVQRAALDPNTNTYQVAMTSGAGTDPVAGSLIPIVCPTGGSYSCRIGDSTRNGAQIGILQQTFNVTSANANFTYMYAVVLENPGHGYYQQPYFNVQMLDQNGNAIPNCGNYSVVSGPGLPGYKGIYYTPDADTVYCKPWTTVFVPLQAYIGQCVTIIATVSDCSLGGHFGYAYFDATCLAGIITSLPVLCGNVATLTATAPSGASTYKWIGPCIVGPTNQQSITVSCPGVYKVAITSIIGSACADTIVDTVLGSVPPTVSVTQPSTNISCYGGSNGTATAAASGGAGLFTYLWSPGGQTNSVATNLSAGTYSVNVIDANGCITSATAIITQPTALTLSTTNTPAKCNGDKTGSASVTANGGTPPYTYSWAPGGGNSSSANNLAAGTYTVTVTDANSCTNTATVSVSQPLALASTISSTAVSCNGGSNGSATVTISSGTSPYNYAWAPKGGYSTSASNLNSGAYTVTTTDANGCIITSTVNVTEPTPIATSGSSSGAICNGGITGSATVVASGGISPYSYFWAPYGGSNPVANGLSAGTYTVTVTDAHNCKNTITIPVTQPALLTALNVSSNVICNGANNGTAKVIATGGITPYSYAWLPNVSTIDSAKNLPVGVYAVIVTDAHNCSTTATINITQPSLLTAIQGPGNNVSCNGGNNGSTSVIAVGGTLPYTYSWTPKGGTSYTASNLPAGTYTVTVTDAHNCPVTSISTISQPPALTASVSTFNNVSCYGGSNGSAYINATGGTGSYTYLWSPKVSITSSAGNLKAGTYTVTVTDANGCTANTTVTISQPTTLNTKAGTSNISCYGGKNGSINISASGGTPSYTYVWNPAVSNNASAGSLTAGNYTVTVTDANGCNTSISATLSQPKPISTTPAMQPPTCNGLQNGAASVSVSGGVPPYKYVWGTSTPQYTSAINNIGAGTYTILVSDANGCTQTDTIKVTQPFALISTIVNTANPICFGDSNGSTSVYVSGGTVPYKYSWNTTPVQTGYIASKLGAGNYTVTVVDANNCPTSATASLTQPTQVITTATAPDSICSGTTVTIMATGSGGNGIYTYQWSNGGGSIATQNVTPVNSTTYTVTAIDGNGCVGKPATVTINTWNLGPANVNVSPLQTVCHGDTVTLFANVTNANSGQVNIQWSNGYNGSGPFKMVLPTDTSFTITVTNQCGSTVTKSIPVKINTLPVIKIPVQSSASCRGVTFTYNDSSSEDKYDSYLWNFGDSTTGNTNPISHTYAQTGTYTVIVIVTSPEGCRSTASAPADVMIYPTAKAIFTADPSEAPIAEPVISFKDGSINTTAWMYDFGDKTTSFEENPVHTYADTGNYLVHLYTNNKFGCADTAQAEVRIDPEFTFYVPDAFTPNGDGVNDFFTGKGIGIIGFDMVIYDRWGQYIFETQDINTGWNGTVNGGTAIAQEDTYVYVIKVVDYLHKVHSYLGSVTIIK